MLPVDTVNKSAADINLQQFKYIHKCITGHLLQSDRLYTIQGIPKFPKNAAETASALQMSMLELKLIILNLNGFEATFLRKIRISF